MTTLTKRRILVTGGCGFIGSNLIEALLWDKENEVLNYDKLTYAGNPDNLAFVLENSYMLARYSFVQGDIANESEFRKAVQDFKPDCIMNLAAESHVDRSIASPQEFLRTNVLGADVVLRTGRDLGIRVIQMSTDEVYGSLVNREADEFYPFDPNSPYSVSKASCDMLAQAYKTTYNSNINIVRGSNCYGLRQHPEKFIPRAITNILRGKPIPLYAKGDNIREWTFTNDFCDGLIAVIVSGKPGQIYNLGHGYQNRVSNSTIAAHITRLMGKDESWIQTVEDRPGHDKGYSLNSNKLKALGWEPRQGLVEGLSRTIEWYQNNPQWWEKLVV